MKYQLELDIQLRKRKIQVWRIEKIGIDRALRASDASCPKGKKMEVRKSLTTRNLKER